MTPVDASTTGFEQFGLKQALLSSLTKMGFTSPTPIQNEVITALLSKEKTDLVALAATGSGKTGAFGIPLAERIDTDKDAIQALVLSPTRELAAQIQDAFTKIMTGSGIRTAVIYGGQSYDIQRGKLKRPPHVIIATPGRLIDMMKQKMIDLSNIQVLVLDEADRMLSMGFEEDLQTILAATHPNDTETGRASCQTWLFSATMGPGIRRILTRYLDKPVHVEMVSDNQGVSTSLEHKFFAVKSGRKEQALARVLETVPSFYGIVFCNTKQDVADLESLLLSRGISVVSLHGDKLQRDRERILRSLKEGHSKILIATDVAARGIDVKNLTHVVHYGLPRELESYVHRSGRTGRNGEDGVVISIVEPADFSKLNRITRSAGVKFTTFEAKNSEQLLTDFVQNQLASLADVSLADRRYRDILKIVEAHLDQLPLGFESGAEWISAFLVHASQNFQQFDDSFWIKDFSMDKKVGASSSRGESRGGYSRGGSRDGDRGGYSRGGSRDGADRGGYSRGAGGDRGGYSRGGDRNGFASNGPRRDFDRGGERADSERKPRVEGDRSFAAPRRDFDRKPSLAGASSDSRPKRPTNRDRFASQQQDPNYENRKQRREKKFGAGAQDGKAETKKETAPKGISFARKPKKYDE